MRSDASVLNKITIIVNIKAFWDLLSSLELPPDLEVNSYVKTLLQMHQFKNFAYLLSL